MGKVTWYKKDKESSVIVSVSVTECDKKSEQIDLKA